MTCRKLLNDLFGRRWWLFVAPESGLVGGLIFGGRSRGPVLGVDCDRVAMTDRELLEKAAEAAEMKIDFKDPVHFKCGIRYFDRVEGGWWNPLESDGDALRLAVKLRLHVDHHSSAVTVWVVGKIGASDFVEDSTDPAATRRAIVRAAAQIAHSASGSPSSERPPAR